MRTRKQLPKASAKSQRRANPARLSCKQTAAHLSEYHSFMSRALRKEGLTKQERFRVAHQQWHEQNGAMGGQQFKPRRQKLQKHQKNKADSKQARQDNLKKARAAKAKAKADKEAEAGKVAEQTSPGIGFSPTTLPGSQVGSLPM